MGEGKEELSVVSSYGWWLMEREGNESAYDEEYKTENRALREHHRRRCTAKKDNLSLIDE